MENDAKHSIKSKEVPQFLKE